MEDTLESSGGGCDGFEGRNLGGEERASLHLSGETTSHHAPLQACISYNQYIVPLYSRAAKGIGETATHKFTSLVFD